MDSPCFIGVKVALLVALPRGSGRYLQRSEVRVGCHTADRRQRRQLAGTEPSLPEPKAATRASQAGRQWLLTGATANSQSRPGAVINRSSSTFGNAAVQTTSSQQSRTVRRLIRCA